MEVGRSLQVASWPTLRGRLVSHLLIIIIIIIIVIIILSSRSVSIIIILIIIIIVVIIPIAPCVWRPSWPRRESSRQT